jgi:hypothetical protein
LVKKPNAGLGCKWGSPVWVWGSGWDWVCGVSLGNFGLLLLVGGYFGWSGAGVWSGPGFVGYGAGFEGFLRVIPENMSLAGFFLAGGLAGTPGFPRALFVGAGLAYVGRALGRFVSGFWGLGFWGSCFLGSACGAGFGSSVSLLLKKDPRIFRFFQDTENVHSSFLRILLFFISFEQISTKFLGSQNVIIP